MRVVSLERWRSSLRVWFAYLIMLLVAPQDRYVAAVNMAVRAVSEAEAGLDKLAAEQVRFS